MPKQPTSEDLGGAPGIDGARSVGSYDVDAYARGAHKMTEAGEHLGASVTKLGEADAAFAARRAREELNAASTQAITGIFKMRGPSADPASPADPQQHAENVANLIYDAAEGIKSGAAQTAYFAAMRPVYAQEVRNAELRRSQDDASAQAAHLEQLTAQLEANVSTGSHDALAAAAIDNLHGSIDEAVDRNLLTPAQAAITKKAAALRLTAATYRNMAQEDPARAVDELTAADSPHPLVPFLPDDIRADLVTQAQLNIRAREIDEGRNAFLADQERRRTVAKTQDNYVALALAGEPGLAVRLANDDTLADDDKQRLLDTAARSTAADPPPVISNAATLKFLDRIRRDDRGPAGHAAAQRFGGRRIECRGPHRRDRRQVHARAPWLRLLEGLLDGRFRVPDAAGVSRAPRRPRAGAWGVRSTSRTTARCVAPPLRARCV